MRRQARALPPLNQVWQVLTFLGAGVVVGGFVLVYGFDHRSLPDLIFGLMAFGSGAFGLYRVLFGYFRQWRLANWRAGWTESGAHDGKAARVDGYDYPDPFSRIDLARVRAQVRRRQVVANQDRQVLIQLAGRYLRRPTSIVAGLLGLVLWAAIIVDMLIPHRFTIGNVAVALVAALFFTLSACMLIDHLLLLRALRRADIAATQVRKLKPK